MKSNIKIEVVIEKGDPEKWHKIYRLVEQKRQQDSGEKPRKHA